jgi:Domain of unknown function (DUF1929)
MLADGSVLATGGNFTGAGLVDMNGGVYNAERWDPATGQWTTLAAQQVTRQYHSTALLLPDGRVLSSGGGICGTCDQVGYLAKNAEIFTPPYLFKKDGSGELAPRPEITGAPSTVNHGMSFQVTTPNAASIRKVWLIRLGSQTHSVEMEQRYLPLGFTAGDGTLTASVPANAHTAVPGVYMLFIVDDAGVPSVAKMVTLESGTTAFVKPAADRVAHVAAKWRHLHLAGEDLARRRGRRLGRQRSEGRVLQRDDQAGRGHDRHLHLPMERRSRRHLHAHRTRDRQLRRDDHQQPGHHHGQQEAALTPRA